MRRRDFIGGVGSAAAWPVVARAQQQTLPVIGVLSNGERDRWHNLLPPLPLGSSRPSRKPVMSRARTSPSNTARRKINSIGYPRLQPISSAAA